jgi:hypothetical protein
MHVPIGTLLVNRGVLTREQIDRALQRQHSTGEPLGLICENLFQICPKAIEEAWAEQYSQLTRTTDPELEHFEPRALEFVTRRQAWQFQVLPIRFDGRELMIATTKENLRRALRFATNVIGVPAYLVLAESEKLRAALCRHYPINGMSSDGSHDTMFADLLQRVAGK